MQVQQRQLAEPREADALTLSRVERVLGGLQLDDGPERRRTDVDSRLQDHRRGQTGSADINQPKEGPSQYRRARLR